MEEARKRFEAERDKILGDLPANVKAAFGLIGFCQLYGNDDDPFVPVIVCNPYDVPPKPVRDIYWFDLYSKGKRSKKLPNLAYLVYHYGANDPGDCYSFIEQDEFIPYEDGVAKGYDRVPSHIQQKIDAGQGLDDEEQAHVRGLQEMREDLAKPQEERKRSVPFQEKYLTDTYSDNDDFYSDENDDGGGTDSDAPPKKKAKTKAPAAKKPAAAAKKKK